MGRALLGLWVISFFIAGCKLAAHGEDATRYEEARPLYAAYHEPGAGYKVVGIKDGDTFVLLIDGREQVVRLAHIDCPEKKQPFGSRAKQYASERCFGRYITLHHQNKYDRNKRLIAELLLPDGRNVNQELVKAGLAWHFKKYSDDAGYAALEIAARKKRVGLWADKAPVAPWEWRGIRRSRAK